MGLKKTASSSSPHRIHPDNGKLMFESNSLTKVRIPLTTRLCSFWKHAETARSLSPANHWKVKAESIKVWVDYQMSTSCQLKLTAEVSTVMSSATFYPTWTESLIKHCNDAVDCLEETCKAEWHMMGSSVFSSTKSEGLKVKTGFDLSTLSSYVFQTSIFNSTSTLRQIQMLSHCLKALFDVMQTSYLKFLHNTSQLE